MIEVKLQQLENALFLSSILPALSSSSRTLQVEKQRSRAVIYRPSLSVVRVRGVIYCTNKCILTKDMLNEGEIGYIEIRYKKMI